MTQPANEKVYLRDEKGALFSVAPNDVAQATKPKGEGGMGLIPASDQDIAAGMARKEAGSASGQAKTALSGATTGLVDAFTALPRAGSAVASSLLGVDDPVKGMTGRDLLETGAYVAGGGDLKGARAAEEFAAAERLRAAENPTTAGVSSLAGNVAGAGLGGLGALGQGAGKLVAGRLGGGLAARVVGAGVTGAVEGAPLNLVAAQDKAYIEGRQLTGEQAMAALGTGALVGAGAGAALKGLGEIFGATRSAIAARRGAAEGVEAEAARGTAPLGAQRAASDAATAAEEQGAVRRILRTSDDNINRSIESTVQAKALPEAAEYVREGVRGRSLGAIREELHGAATTEMAAATNESLRAVQRLEDRVTNRGWKLSQIEAHEPTFAADALEQTKAHAAAIRQDIHETIAQLGKDAPKTLKGLAAQLDKNDFIIQGATSPAKANLAMDQIRRDLLKTTQGFTTATRRVADVDTQDLMQVLTRKTGEHYETAQKFLMDPKTWGAQGEAQAAVNTAYADLIRAKTNSVPAFTSTVQGAEYMGQGVARDQAIAHEGKILGTISGLGKPQGAVGQRALGDWLTAGKKFAEATQKYGLDAGDQKAIGSVQQALSKFETTLGDVTRKSGALDQAEAWLTKSKEGTGLLGGGVLGSVVAGPVGTAAGVAAGAVLNPAKFMAQRLAVEEAASRAQRVVGTTLDGFFSGARRAMAATGEATTPGLARAATAASRSALPAITALELFQGRHATPEAAYKARVEEVRQANLNYGQKIRDNAGHVFGSTADMDPHSVGAAVVATTKAMQYLESKIPAPTVNTSLTPITSSYAPSRMAIQQYADIWAAVSRPLDIIKALPSGAPTPEQIQAIKQVYPRFYQYIREEVMQRLTKLDRDGIEVPIRERIILDTLLDLDGAGEPTFSNAFAAQYGPAMRDAQPDPQGPAPRPPSGGTSGAAERTTTKTDKMLGGSS